MVEQCDTRIAPRGGQEIVFALKAVLVDVLHRIMQRVEKLPGGRRKIRFSARSQLIPDSSPP